MLGSVDLRADDGHELRDAIVQPKCLALLAYLAAGSNTFHRRESLLALFWPELDEPHARDALKQAVSYLRHALAENDEPVIVNRGADELSLSSQAVWSDVRAFERAIELGNCGEALELYRGDLLEGLSPHASNDFDDWLSRERGRLRRLAADAARRLAQKRERDGDSSGAVSAARRAVALAEFDEPVLRDLLTLLDRVGDRAGAIKAYDAFVARLAAEFEIEPAAETRQVIEVIRARQTLHPLGSRPAQVIEPSPSLPLATAQGVARAVPGNRQVRSRRRRASWWATALGAVLMLSGAAWTWRARTSGAPRIDGIAVLPIENLMGPDQQYFVDAMHDAVVGELGRLSALTVISRQSVIQYRNSRKPEPEIARDLGVQALVHMSIFRAGDIVRIQMAIHRAVPDERQLLSRSYEANLSNSNVLALQGEVARDIAQQINVTLGAQITQRVESARPAKRAAWDAWARGRYEASRMSAASLRRCIAYADSALAIDQKYGPAFALSAGCYGLLANFGDVSPHEAYPKTKDAALTALALDSTLADAHFALAWALGSYYWDWPAADREYQRGLELDPGSATGHSKYALFLSWIGRFDDALAHVRRAEAIDPISADIAARSSVVLIAARRFDEAVAAAKRAIVFDSTFVWGHVRLAMAYAAQGMGQQAVQAAERVVSLDSGSARQANLAYMYARFGRRSDAMRTLKQMERHRLRMENIHIALAYAALGDTGQALSRLERAYREHEGNMMTLKWEQWDGLRGEPRFQQILRRMRFPKD
jgi:DNA-binding SARP family transcriptional activator/TolB-like protein